MNGYSIHIWWDTLEKPEERAQKRQYMEAAVLAAQRGQPVPDDVKLSPGRVEAPGTFGYEIFPVWLQELFSRFGFRRDIPNVLYIYECKAGEDSVAASKVWRQFWSEIVQVAEGKGIMRDGRLCACPDDAEAKKVQEQQRAEAKEMLLGHLTGQIVAPFSSDALADLSR